MGRRVALVRFDSGAELYCVYCDTADVVIGRELYDTTQMAQAARDAWESTREGRGTAVEQAAASEGAKRSEEPLTVFPYGTRGDFKYHFASRGSRSHRWLSGPKGPEDVAREERGKAASESAFGGYSPGD